MLTRKMAASLRPFGLLKSGARADLISLSNDNGMHVQLTNFGALITSVKVPAAGRAAEEVTLCHGDLASLEGDHPYYGATIGRVGNRIAKGRFSVAGKDYTLAVNNGPNHLHGGLVGLSRVLWDASIWAKGGDAGVVFTYSSHDGEEGYPGNVKLQAAYSLTAKNELVMEFSATTDKATPINMCNHAYWNLCGGLADKIYNHVLQLHAPFVLPADESSIPTGVVAPVVGTDFDFLKPRPIGEVLQKVFNGTPPGYDCCYARAGKGDVPPNGLGFGLLAVLSEPKSGRTMTVSTDAPGVQLYTANYLGGSAPHDQHRAVCLETQGYPNAINEAGFPSTVVLPGDKYYTKTVHAFTW